MTKKLVKSPSTQRSFANCWGELDFVCKKIRYWLYTRTQSARAQRYVERLARILHGLPENDMSILREEGMALFHELTGNRSNAIVHRQREIELMQRLHKDARSGRYTASTRSYLLRDRDEADLQERRAILKKLHGEVARENRRSTTKVGHDAMAGLL